MTHCAVKGCGSDAKHHVACGDFLCTAHYDVMIRLVTEILDR